PIALVRLFGQLHLGGLSPLLVRGLTKSMVLDQSVIQEATAYVAKRSLKESLPEIRQWVQKIGGPEVLREAGRDLPWL
ncbi:MAG: hypothetical protein AAFQ68_10900, partial [Bacteroidota bacterium]